MGRRRRAWKNRSVYMLLVIRVSATSPASHRASRRSCSSKRSRLKTRTPTRSAVGPVHQRNVQADHVGRGTLDDLVGLERETGRGVVDGLGSPHDQPFAGQRHLGHLVVVLQQHRHLPTPDRLDLLGDQGRDQVRRHRVGPVQERTQQPLTKPLGPVGPPRRAQTGGSPSMVQAYSDCDQQQHQTHCL